jgi:hypothetical protein
MQNSIAAAGTDNWNDTKLAQLLAIQRESTPAFLECEASARDARAEELALARWLDDGGALGIA